MATPALALSAAQVDIVPGSKPKPTKPTARPKTTPKTKAGAKRPNTQPSGMDLFPVYGVTLGVTTKQQLERLATRATDIDPGTGKVYPFYYIYHGKFYWNDAGVATSMVVTQYWDYDPTPEDWLRLGWNWSLSYNSWISLLRQQGYSITIEESPRLIKDKDRDTFLAKISAVKRTRIPLKITLIFDRHKSVFRRGTTADSNYTLDTIKVEVL